MKKIILILSVFIFLTSCNNELYNETDKFVESLETTYESYGLLGGTKYSTTTNDGLYRIMPIGRLINVKIQEVVSNEDYEDLIEDLESHYKNDSRVKSVYICNGGTIMIDCRN